MFIFNTIDPLESRNTNPPDCTCPTASVTSHAVFQTGAGKTHTMEGYPDPPDLRGIIPKSFEVRCATHPWAKSESLRYWHAFNA